MSSAVKSQKLILAAGAACVLALAVVYVLRMQSCNKGRKQKKKPQQEQVEQQQQQSAECEETKGDALECSSLASDCLDQQENECMQISAIVAPETGADDLRLDSGIGSPKGTPSLENSEQLVEQASDFIEESFSAVYSQANGIDSSSLFVETSTISIEESELQRTQTTPRPEPSPQVAAVAALGTALGAICPEVEEIVADICRSAAAIDMTEKAPEAVASPAECPTADVGDSASAEIAEPAKQLESSPGASPTREIRKSVAKKDGSPVKEKVSRRKAATRSKDHINKEQVDSSSSKARNNSDDRNNNNARRQSTESDVVTDSKSEGSADSSQAGSDSCPSSVTSVLYKFKHEFELPADLCGRLIGRHGANVKDIRDRTGAIVTVRPHPIDISLKQVYVVGKLEESVKLAMAEIRKKFPLKLYPHLTLSPMDRQSLVGLSGLTPSYLSLPEDQDTMVIVTAMEGCNRLFLQSPQNTTYDLFMQLELKMAAVHGAPGAEPPALPENSLRPNAICVVQDSFSWYRVAIDRVISREEVRVKFVDYGGFDVLHPSRLKQIRSDFIYIPFQAIEVILADMESPNPGGTWPNESINALKSHADEANNIVLARVVGYSGSVPCAQLTCINRESGDRYSLSHQLIFEGHAKSVTDSNRSSPNASGSEGSECPTFSQADFPQLGATPQTC
ncbi:KH domain-containing protein akap-1 [Galendromus occidentalis]|uniref:KH domain-containing protein akap-1 n=1 Tax=Galendromus occidentalis TaxID=34638 RepID=A0AAJ6VWM9_9ACAR|nr:KH domain-containing protein akap-1 [Galendromus occidentalis]